MDIFVVAFFALLSVTILYPFLFVLARSLSSGDAILSKMTILPQGITLANYETARWRPESRRMRARRISAVPA